MIDILRLGEPPGTIAVLQPDSSAEEGEQLPQAVDSHSMTPTAVLSTLSSLGGQVDQVCVVGCQPETTELAAAVGPACELVQH